jgi:hypothetical protein
LAVAEPASLAARRCRFVKNAKADSLIAFDAFGKFSPRRDARAFAPYGSGNRSFVKAFVAKKQEGYQGAPLAAHQSAARRRETGQRQRSPAHL